MKMFHKSDPSVRWGRLVSGILSCLVAAGLGAAEPESVPLQKRTRVADSETLFSELGAETTGVTFVNPIDTKHPLKRLYTSAFGGGGVAAGDVDGDGRCDLYFVSGARENRLYRNLGEGKFADITGEA